jgi:hypothetical protein
VNPRIDQQIVKRMLALGHEASLRWRDVMAAGAILVHENMRFGVLVLALTLLAEPAVGMPVFRAPFRAFDAVPGAGAFALGDFDADGDMDITAASVQAASVVILLNDGTGEFQPGFRIAPGDEPVAVTAADVNADGGLDLVIGGRVHVYVYLGQGDGTFRLSGDGTAGAGPHPIAVGDVNRDGRPDVVVANSDPFYGRSVSFFPGNGDGTLGARIDSPMDGVSASSIALADFDGDGQLDLVAGYSGGATFVYVMRGLGDGRFGPIAGHDSAYSPAVVATGDLNGDGKSDFVAGGEMDGSVSIHLGRGDGAFAPKVEIPAAGAGFVALTDLDHDGHLDILTAGSAIRGRGDGSFETPVPFVTDGGPAMAAAGDIDGDGVPDLITSHPAPGTVAVMHGLGDGRFDTPLDVQTVARPQAVAEGDVDGDGHTDLAVASYEGPLTILLGDGAGGFRRGTDVPDSPALAVALSDLNHDGALDLIILDYSTLTTRLGSGTGTFGAPSTLLVRPGSEGLAIGDLNGDGLPDVVLTTLGHYDSAFPPHFLPDSIVTVLLGAGDGSFASRLEVATGVAPLAVSVADMNGDGRKDLVVANVGSSSISVLLGHGDGTFLPRIDTATEEPDAMTSFDLDVDGHVDVATASRYEHTLTILTGSGDGTFRSQRSIPGVGPVQWIGCGDWDGDGRPDLAVTREDANTVRLFMGLGIGEFSKGDFYGAGSGPASGLAADLNADGRPDIVVVNTQGSSVTPLLNIAGEAAPPVTVTHVPPKTNLLLGSLRTQSGTVALSLASLEPASLSLFDVTGRQVLRLALGAIGPGAHDIWVAGASRLRSGVYFARLAQGAQAAHARWLVIR